MIVFAVAGSLVLFSERKLIWQAISSYRWLSTEGIVVDSSDASFTTAGVDRYTSVGTTKWSETKHVYEYQVAGKVYQTSTYCFGAYVERASAAFLIGSNIRVYYDPKHPSNAVVKRGLQPSMLIGPMLLAAGALMFAQRLFSTR